MAIRHGIIVNSYMGISPMAEHYYGTAWRTDDTHWHTERHDLERTLDEPGAKKLNRLDNREGSWTRGSGFRWKPGMQTNRFDTEDAVIAAGITYLTHHYGEEVATIEYGDPVWLDDIEIVWERQGAA